MENHNLEIFSIFIKNKDNQEFCDLLKKSKDLQEIYKIFVNFGYKANIKKLESEILTVLNIKSIQSKISEFDLEKISGGTNNRQKIMSGISLLGLCGGLAMPI